MARVEVKVRARWESVDTFEFETEEEAARFRNVVADGGQDGLDAIVEAGDITADGAELVDWGVSSCGARRDHRGRATHRGDAAGLLVGESDERNAMELAETGTQGHGPLEPLGGVTAVAREDIILLLRALQAESPRHAAWSDRIDALCRVLASAELLTEMADDPPEHALKAAE